MKIRELLYGGGTEFDPNKRCLPHTRVKFLGAIVKWVNDPRPESLCFLARQVPASLQLRMKLHIDIAT